ncbi:hypothetical protein Dimus_032161 [Dionaea muscipula]
MSALTLTCWMGNPSGHFRTKDTYAFFSGPKVTDSMVETGLGCSRFRRDLEVRLDVLRRLGLTSTARDWEGWWRWLLKVSVGRTVKARQRRGIGAALVILLENSRGRLAPRTIQR